MPWSGVDAGMSLRVHSPSRSIQSTGPRQNHDRKFKPVAFSQIQTAADNETVVTTKMVRHYGRSPRGERLVASVPHGHWKTLTFIAALRFDGITAPYVIDGAMDGPTFIEYVERVLTPTLTKGDIVFMDNLRTHKVDGVRQAIEAVGASLRYLPAYSPDLNPIEQAFSKLKTAMRKGAARTAKALWKLIGRLTKTFAPEQCVNYFRHAGYGR